MQKGLVYQFFFPNGNIIYVQSAFALDAEEKKEPELRSLTHIKDSFQKVVITGGMQPTYRNENGILILNLFDFLLDKVRFW